MALELLVRNTNFYQYRGCAGNWIPFPPGATTGYHGWCGTGQQYFESIVLLDSFVYDQAADRYRFVTMNNIANWPSWDFSTSIIHPETGVEEQRIPLVGYAVAHAWTESMYNGGLNKVFAGYLATTSGYGIVEVLLPDGIPSISMIANPIVTAAQISVLSATNFGFALCPERKLITLLSGVEGISVYDYSATPAAATRLYYHPFPESFGWSMGYEDDERCWALFAGSIFGSPNDGRQSLVKYNYRYNKIELLTELQVSATPDRMAKVAWDSKRKKLGAVRIKNDESNGAPNNAFEIYAPRPAMTRVTVPVNIDRLSEDRVVPFVSHVLGSKAEAGGAREVTISCSPTAALVTIPKQVTESNGRVKFEITPPTPSATETLTVSYTETKDT